MTVVWHISTAQGDFFVGVIYNNQGGNIKIGLNLWGRAFGLK